MPVWHTGAPGKDESRQMLDTTIWFPTNFFPVIQTSKFYMNVFFFGELALATNTAS